MKRVVGIYLAAGLSSRMGCDKLALPLGGMALGSHALYAAIRSPLKNTIVVSREDCEAPSWIDPMLRQRPWSLRWRAVYCPLASQGQAHSLQWGLSEAIRRAVDAVMILLSDQPFITPTMLFRLIEHYSRSNAAYVAARRLGCDYPQPPVIIDRQLFPELFKLQGDAGARRLLRNEAIPGHVVDFDDPALFYDVDTMKQYDLLKTTGSLE
jgi:molybdenum cofactor cytidylyltransferase